MSEIFDQVVKHHLTVKRVAAFLRDFEKPANACSDKLPDATVETYARAIVATIFQPTAQTAEAARSVKFQEEISLLKQKLLDITDKNEQAEALIKMLRNSPFVSEHLKTTVIDGFFRR